MAVRAKFTVQCITTYKAQGGAESNEINLYAVTDKSIPDNEQFVKYTSSGTIKMMCDNPAVLEQMQPGKTFYVDFTSSE